MRQLLAIGQDVGFTFFRRCDDIQSIQGEQKEGCGKFIAKQPKLLDSISNHLSSQVSIGDIYVKGIVFLKLHRFLSLAH
jgi:hypothetical protein